MRPKKCRFVNFEPNFTYFKPRGVPVSVLKIVELENDELEALRLADFNGFSQEESAQKMGISRQTFGRIIEKARYKITDALLNGKAIKIIKNENYVIINKKEDKMKIAVSSDDGINVCGHPGRCEKFIIFEVDGQNIISKNIIENTFTNHYMQHRHQMHGEGGGHHHASHHSLLNALEGCTTLITAGMGHRLVEDLTRNNITPIITDEVSAEEAVKKFVSGEIKNDLSKACAH